MPFPLETFSVDDVRVAVQEVRALPKAGATIADESQAVCEYLYGALLDDAGRPACALVRLYATERFAALDPEQQAFASELHGAAPGPDVRCLTLLGTAGEEPDWNDRRRSRGHRAIPLPTEEFVERLPMVAQLVRQLGLEIGVVVDPPTGREAFALAARDTDVFHVPVAEGSPYTPAQDFVREYRIASAVGFGGVFLSGVFFAVVLFSRVPVSEPVARTLKILAQPIRARFLPYQQRLARR